MSIVFVWDIPCAAYKPDKGDTLFFVRNLMLNEIVSYFFLNIFRYLSVVTWTLF